MAGLIPLPDPQVTDNSSGPDDAEVYTANAEGRLASYQKNSEPAASFTYDHAGERTVTQIGSRTITDLVDNANPTGYSQVLKRTDTGGGTPPPPAER